MSWNGTGTFSRTQGLATWQNQSAAGVKILSLNHDNSDNDIATGVNACLAKNGENAATGNLPMGGFAHTNVAAATTRTQYARLDQVQDSKATLITLTSGGATDILTGTLPFAWTTPSVGQLYSLIAGATNTIAVTLNINGTGAKAITKNGALALTRNDILNGRTLLLFYDGVEFQLLNPSAPSALTSFTVYATGGAQGLLTGVNTTIVFNNTLFDTGANVTLGGGGVFTAPATGIYYLTSTVTIDQAGALATVIPDYIVTINTSVGGATTRNSAALGAHPGLSASGVFNLTAGATANIIASQNSGASMQTVPSQAGVFFSGFRLS